MRAQNCNRWIVPFLAIFAPLAALAQATAPLPAFQGGGPLLGVAEPIAGPPYVVRWQFKAEGKEGGRTSIENNPTIAAGLALVADAAGNLRAIDLVSGKPKWTYRAEGGFATTPLALNGKVYLGDLDGVLHCVDASSGTKAWTFDSESSIHSSPNVTPDGKTIIFGNDGAQVFGIGAADGKKLWEGKSGDRVNACPAVGFGAALFTGCDAKLLAIDISTGAEKFAAELGGLAPGSAAVLEDRLVIGTGEGTVVALSPDGQRTLWKYDQVDDQQAMFYSSPAVSDGIVVIGCRDRNVHAIDVRTGKRAWAFKTRGDVDATPTISAGRVFIPSKDKKLYVLDLKTGEKQWEFTAGRAITAGVAIGKDADNQPVIVLGDTAGNVYCLEPRK
jgi:outer membrane protein assembly factor BamB